VYAEVLGQEVLGPDATTTESATASPIRSESSKTGRLRGDRGRNARERTVPAGHTAGLRAGKRAHTILQRQHNNGRAGDIAGNEPDDEHTSLPRSRDDGGSPASRAVGFLALTAAILAARSTPIDGYEAVHLRGDAAGLLGRRRRRRRRGGHRRSPLSAPPKERRDGSASSWGRWPSSRWSALPVLRGYYFFGAGDALSLPRLGAPHRRRTAQPRRVPLSRHREHGRLRRPDDRYHAPPVADANPAAAVRHVRRLGDARGWTDIDEPERRRRRLFSPRC